MIYISETSGVFSGKLSITCSLLLSGFLVTVFQVFSHTIVMIDCFHCQMENGCTGTKFI